MVQAFIFDLDGTIADTVASLAYTSNRALRRAGYSRELPPDRFRLYAGDGATEMLRRCLAELGETDEGKLAWVMDCYAQEFDQGCLHQVAPYRGLKAALEQLKARGMRLGVCTNKQHQQGVRVVEYLYGRGYFDCILGQKPTHRRKPSPDGALLVARQLDVSPRECVYVGDTNTDMRTGKAAGMFTVGVLWGFRSQRELEDSGADAIISHPGQLVDFLP